MAKQEWTKIVWPVQGAECVMAVWARVFPRIPLWAERVILAAYIPHMFGVKGDYCYRAMGLSLSMNHIRIFSVLRASERDAYKALRLRVARYLYRQVKRHSSTYEQQVGLLRQHFPRELRLLEVLTPAAVTRGITMQKVATLSPRTPKHGKKSSAHIEEGSQKRA